MKLSECGNLEPEQIVWVVLDSSDEEVVLSGEPLDMKVLLLRRIDSPFEIFFDELEAWTFSLNMRKARLQKEIDRLETEYVQVIARLPTRG